MVALTGYNHPGSCPSGLQRGVQMHVRVYSCMFGSSGAHSAMSGRLVRVVKCVAKRVAICRVFAICRAWEIFVSRDPGCASLEAKISRRYNVFFFYKASEAPGRPEGCTSRMVS